MAKGQFEKGNKFGGRPIGSRNKKTIATESLQALNLIGINPIETSKILIDGLVNNTELSNKEQISLLSVMSSLWKFSLLTRAEEIRLDELQHEKEILQVENQNLKDFIGTPDELLKQLKEK